MSNKNPGETAKYGALLLQLCDGVKQASLSLVRHCTEVLANSRFSVLTSVALFLLVEKLLKTTEAFKLLLELLFLGVERNLKRDRQACSDLLFYRCTVMELL